MLSTNVLERLHNVGSRCLGTIRYHVIGDLNLLPPAAHGVGGLSPDGTPSDNLGRNNSSFRFAPFTALQTIGRARVSLRCQAAWHFMSLVRPTVN